MEDREKSLFLEESKSHPVSLVLQLSEAVEHGEDVLGAGRVRIGGRSRRGRHAQSRGRGRGRAAAGHHGRVVQLDLGGAGPGVTLI